MRFLTVLVIWGALLLGVADLAFGGEIHRYEAPDGSLAFTDDPSRIPSSAASSAVKVVPGDARWSRIERRAAPHRWYAPNPGYETRRATRSWAGAAEAARRGVEDAAVLETFADEIGIGRRAAAQNRENALRRAERLEESCRTSGDCLPGYLR